MMIRPSRCTGANTAERVPSIRCASPRRMRFHWSYRSVMRSELCSMATSVPKQAEKRSIICGVSTISGTSTMTDLPLRRTSCARRR